MIRRLPLQSKLLLAYMIPLIAIIGLAMVALNTFQTVKVNGPRYNKIAATKDLEADILPPPGYLVETHLIVLSAIDADLTDSESTIEVVRANIKKHRDDFEASHAKWQRTLPKNTSLRSQMREAYLDGRRYFHIVEVELFPKMEGLLDRNVSGSNHYMAHNAAVELIEKRLTPVYESHRRHIVSAVASADARQVSIERDTRAGVDGQLRVLGLTALAVLAFAAILAVLAARSISRPIKRLTANALNTAEHELPETLARIQAGAPKSSVVTSDLGADEHGGEIGDLVRAFDRMRSNSIDLASDQAVIRRNVSNNLVNIARRNQVLLKRTLSAVSLMERDERDPAKLEQLFELDHLTTRMRRNAESLLVLAASEGPKFSTTELTVADTVRSALSQIESYGRVDLSHFDHALVKGSLVTDVAHLIAEFLENATHFSPPETRVTVGGRMRLDGYVISVHDEGVGMSADAFAEANRRLASPAEFIAEPTKVLGLAVAGHLAARHGLDVSLSENVAKGVTVRVHLPLSSVVGDVPVELGQDDGVDQVLSDYASPIPFAFPTLVEFAGDTPLSAGSTDVSRDRQESRNVRSEKAPGDTGDLRAPSGLPMRKRKAASTSAEGASSSAGLAKRVPGATISTGNIGSKQPTNGAVKQPSARRDPNSVRNALTSLQDGTRSAERKINNGKRAE